MENSQLFKRIKEAISEIPYIDLHTHIRTENPNAKNLAEIIFYHFVSLELRSSGADIAKDLPTFAHPLPNNEELIERLLSKYIPLLKNIENTTTYFCLRHIFEDLYEFDFQGINANNWKVLYDKVLKTAHDDNWTKSILQKKAMVETVVSVNFEGAPKGRWIESGLFSPSPERGILSSLKKDLLQGLSFEKALNNLLDQYQSWKVSSITGGGLPPDFYPFNPSLQEMDTLLKKWLEEKEISKIEESKLDNLLANKLLKILNEREIPWVVTIGRAVPPFPSSLPGQTILQINHNVLPNLCKLLPLYPKVKIFPLLNSMALSQELCIVARMFPNIYPLGIQWHNFFSSYIESIIRERLEIVPMNRPIGFMSDAYSTEWLYGKLTAFREALVKVLTQKIEEKIYTEETAVRVARKWLYDNPKEAYFNR